MATDDFEMETLVNPAPRPLLLPDGRPAAQAWTLDPAMKHLNHGSFGAVPLAAQQEQQRLRVEMDRAPVVWFPALPGRVAGALAAIADFLRVDVRDLALVSPSPASPNTPGTTSGTATSWSMKTTT